MKNRLVALAGPPCSGKSSIGVILSQMLGADFIETDREVEKLAGMSVSTIFETTGEPAFRAIEKQVIMKVLSTDRFTVIALGGGSLIDIETKNMVERACRLFTLTAPPDVLWARNTGGRPLAENKQVLTDLLETRADHYSSLKNPLDTLGKTPLEVAETIAEQLRKEDHSRWFQ